MSYTELKPCPFCGGDGDVMLRIIDGGDYSDEYQYYASCTRCHTESRRYDHPDIPNAMEYAIASWNSRQIEDKLNAKIDKLEIEKQQLEADLLLIQEKYAKLQVETISKINQHLHNKIDTLEKGIMEALTAETLEAAHEALRKAIRETP